jgi:hypothetical protein
MAIRIGTWVRIQETGEEGEVIAMFKFSGGRKEYSVVFDHPNQLGDRGYRCPESSLTAIPKPRRSKLAKGKK